LEPSDTVIKDEPASAAASPVAEQESAPQLDETLPEATEVKAESSTPSFKTEEEWTREEDKMILQVFEQGGTANMLEEVKDLLPLRTLDQVKFEIILLNFPLYFIF
jgi:hypothetical protein